MVNSARHHSPEASGNIACVAPITSTAPKIMAVLPFLFAIPVALSLFKYVLWCDEQDSY
jgi:hypothetical protein